MALAKLLHYIKRNRYKSDYRMLPDLAGGSGACGQDLLIAELLNKKREGFFIDVGANDGVTISNTMFLEKELGWHGVAIEPIPSVFEKLCANRSCDLVQGCITPVAGTQSFLEMTGCPNMLSTLSANRKGLIARRMKNNAQRHKSNIKEINVQCYTFNQIAERSQRTVIDFLSLDTEGGELDILKSINYSNYHIKTISVENNYFDRSVRKFLESKGFIYVGNFKVDEIYIHGGRQLQAALNK